MKKHAAIATIGAVLLAAGAFVVAYQHWSRPERNPVIDILTQLPSDASTVIFINLTALRQSPFLAELAKWAPQTSADADYQQFVQSTGFNYETDLDRIGIAILHRGQESALVAVADGRFNHDKIASYASQTGTRESHNGREIFSIRTTGDSRRISFSFLRNDRIAMTNGPDLDSRASQPQPNSDAQAWNERFRRLAGSPIFAVVRQDPAVSAALGAAPDGLRSPQLSLLIDQLQWITVAGKPENDRLRIVVEGEAAQDPTARQLSDVINGLLVLAEAGLNDAKTRRQLPPQTREAYLEVLKSADVSRIDRGETKAVRLIFDLTPDFLEAARTAAPQVPPAPQSKHSPNRGAVRN